MKTDRRLSTTHGLTFVIGALALWWFASPLAPGDWESMGAIHWGWLLVPCVLAGHLGGAVEGLALRRGWFWAMLAALAPTAAVALFATGLFVGNLFGSTSHTTTDLLVAALLGWALFCVIGYVVAAALARPTGHASSVSAERADTE